MKNILFVFGTRPEAIKMAPLIKAFRQDSRFSVKVGITAQHRQMLDQVLAFFDIKADYDLDIMVPNQTLHELTSNLILRITNEILLKEQFDLVFVQGDTTTVMAASLAAFYQKIKIAHIEAGLRSHDMYSPFPEEANRVITSNLASLHFCPTEQARVNLSLENITENVHVVGNTVIDALFAGLEKIERTDEASMYEAFGTIDFSKKILLVTCHRRENFGKPFLEICDALLEIADRHPDVQIVYPVHPNPNIKATAHEVLQRNNIELTKPLDYHELIWLMHKSNIILTDSGGIQEEAPSLGKPVLVLRDVTERMEGVTAGTAVLVGSNKERIISETEKLLTDESYYASIATASNPYGDGKSSEKIRDIILEL